MDMRVTHDRSPPEEQARSLQVVSYRAVRYSLRDPDEIHSSTHLLENALF